MNPPEYSGEQINQMKADAIRRARQMHSRSRQYNNSPEYQSDRASTSQSPRISQNSRNSAKLNFDISKLLSSFGLNNDQLIIILLIMMISGEKENLPLIMALLYIAL